MKGVIASAIGMLLFSYFVVVLDRIGNVYIGSDLFVSTLYSAPMIICVWYAAYKLFFP